MATAEQARLGSYTVRLPSIESDATVDQRTFMPLAVYGCLGLCRWHGGRVDLKDGRSLSLLVRDMGAGTAAARCWRRLLDAIRQDGWCPADAEDMADTRQARLVCVFGHAIVRDHVRLDRQARGVLLRNDVEGILEDYDRAIRAESRYTPEHTQCALRRLQKALADVRRDPVALEFLDAAQYGVHWDIEAVARRGNSTARQCSVAELRERFRLPRPLEKPLPPSYGNGTLVVQARELSERLSKIAVKATQTHAAAVRRGRKQQVALRVLIHRLAYAFERQSGRRATAGTGRGGGAFRHFLTAVLDYGAALYETPAPSVGSRMINGALGESCLEKL